MLNSAEHEIQTTHTEIVVSQIVGILIFMSRIYFFDSAELSMKKVL